MSETQVEGFIRFYITTTPDEMRRWPANAITDFFNGLAQIVYMAGQNAKIEAVVETTNESTT